MIVKLLTEHHLVFLSLKGGCRGSSEATHVKMPLCWKSHALAHYYYLKLGAPNSGVLANMGPVTENLILSHTNNTNADQPAPPGVL